MFGFVSVACRNLIKNGKIKMSGQEITDEEIERLREYVGKEVRINVHVDEGV